MTSSSFFQQAKEKKSEQNSLDTMIEQANIPGISVATISQNGEIVTQIAGVINNETKQKVVDETVFEAASLSKPVFAYIVLKMVERGELDLDTPLYKLGEFGPPVDKIRHPEQFNEKFSDNYKKLTVRTILSHQAGLPNEFERDKPQTFDYVSAVGEQFNYSGEAYCFLQEVIEKIASPKKLEDLAKDEFEKIGMTHSSFLPPTNAPNQAVGHRVDGSVDKNQHFYGIHPAASLYTTASDYGKFLKACMNMMVDMKNEFIRKHLFEPVVELSGKDTKAMQADIPDEILKQISWGLGIGLQKNKDGSLTAFHWGDNQTCRNFAAINLSTNQAIACFTNSANGPNIFKQVAEPVVGDLTPICRWLYPREGFKLQETISPSQKNEEDKPRRLSH